MTVRKYAIGKANTVSSKIIRALEIILAIFLWFDCKFLSSHIVMNSLMPDDHDLKKIFFKKCIRYEFFDTNYFKYSNNFAVDCIRKDGMKIS